VAAPTSLPDFAAYAETIDSTAGQDATGFGAVEEMTFSGAERAWIASADKMGTIAFAPRMIFLIVSRAVWASTAPGSIRSTS
jgi:hypothetical protein